MLSRLVDVHWDRVLVHWRAILSLKLGHDTLLEKSCWQILVLVAILSMRDAYIGCIVDLWQEVALIVTFVHKKLLLAFSQLSRRQLLLKLVLWDWRWFAKLRLWSQFWGWTERSCHMGDSRGKIHMRAGRNRIFVIWGIHARLGHHNALLLGMLLNHLHVFWRHHKDWGVSDAHVLNRWQHRWWIFQHHGLMLVPFSSLC